MYRVEQKKPAKLSELSLNFPKLADWLCMGWSVCQAAAKAGNSNRGKVFLHQAVDIICRHEAQSVSFQMMMLQIMETQ